MNDKQVLIIIMDILRAALPNNGFSNVLVLRNYQRTQQGVPEQPVIYIHKVVEDRYGHPEEKNTYNETNQNFDTTTRFISRVTWQVTARLQEEISETALTAGDLIKTVADIMEFSSTRQTLLNNGIGIEKVTDIRPIYELNDKDQNEFVPNFDFTLNYNKIYTETVAAVDDIELNFNRI